jgi:DNA gyrase/topoisomerase IV subunit A
MLPLGGAKAPAAAAVPDVLVATANGYGFRATPDLSETTRAGRRLARVADDDELIAIVPIRAKQVVLAATNGKMLRFGVDQVPVLTGPGRGVILMRPDDGEKVVGAVVIAPKAKFWAVPRDGGERELAGTDVPEGKRAQKGQKVVKRGGVAALRGEDD